MLRKVTLESVITAIFEEKGKTIPSSVLSTLSRCSKELANAADKEEFEEILAKYSLLDDALKRAGLLFTEFEKIVEDLKEEYYR